MEEVFYKVNPFEKLPMVIYLLIIILDGFLYYGLEFIISYVDIKGSFLKIWNIRNRFSIEKVKF